MKIITLQQIKDLNVSPATCVDWVKESFSIKSESQLPAKISVHPQGYDFYTAMPCLLPERYDRVALKMVHRVSGATPALGSDLLLYKASTGELLALMDATWITAMRTGATAVLAARTLRRSDDAVYGLVGLGNTARATVLCLLESEPAVSHTILLQRYKDQAELFIERFKAYSNVEFRIVDSFRDILAGADVIFSCITDASVLHSPSGPRTSPLRQASAAENAAEPTRVQSFAAQPQKNAAGPRTSPLHQASAPADASAGDGLFCTDESLFRPGCTLIPIHVRGFQNCDLFFDKIFGDDTEPLRSWKYFDRYRSYAELGDVLSGAAPGRTSDSERIISYNYGLGLHDALFATHLYDLLPAAPAATPADIDLTSLSGLLPKFWL